MRYSSGSFVDYSRLPITETPIWLNTVGLLQLLLSSISHGRQLTSRDPTFAPRTPAPSPKTTVAYICLWSAPGEGQGYGGVYPGRGQMSSTGADDGRSYSHGPPLNINGLHLGTL